MAQPCIPSMNSAMIIVWALGGGTALSLGGTISALLPCCWMCARSHHGSPSSRTSLRTHFTFNKTIQYAILLRTKYDLTKRRKAIWINQKE